MRGAGRFFSREKQVFLVGFSLTIPQFPRKSQNRLNTSLLTIKIEVSMLFTDDVAVTRRFRKSISRDLEKHG